MLDASKVKLEKFCLNFVNNFVLIDQYSPSNCPGNMALPITQIMAQLQGGRDGAEEDISIIAATKGFRATLDLVVVHLLIGQMESLMR